MTVIEGSPPAAPVAFFVVDVFADAPFYGNPAAVVLTEDLGLESWRRQVAAELNQPTTAFLGPEQFRGIPAAVVHPHNSAAAVRARHARSRARPIQQWPS